MSPRLAPQEARNATVIARAISSIMPGFRAFSSDTAPLRKGRPPQTYMTVPSTGEIHATPAMPGSAYPTSAPNMWLNATTGTAITSMVQNRRRNCPT